jgi:hypothetical protein
MTELAIADNPAFTVSRIELDRGGRSYSVDTLEALRAARRRTRTRTSLVHPVGRGAGRVPDLAQARADPRAVPPGGRAARRV